MMRGLLLGLALFCGGACSGAEPELRELRVYAAASLQGVLQSAADGFADREGCAVRFHFAGSNELTRQILAGASADVILTADMIEMDRLEDAQLLVEGSRKTFLMNRMVLIEPEDSQPRGEGPRVLALASEAVPAGRYARTWLESREDLRGLLEECRVVSTNDVRSALAAVESGAADLGCVYQTDALLGRGIVVRVEQEDSDWPLIRYPIAVQDSSGHPELAASFVALLRSRVMHFEMHGFEVW